MVTASKFTMEQLDLMEQAYKDGLCSTNMSIHAERYESLSHRTNVEVSKLKTWINNRKRKESACSSATLDSGGSKSFKRAPCSRRTSAWNLFLSRAFKGELKDVPKEEKSRKAKEMYERLSVEEKEKLEAEAKSSVDLKNINGDEAEKCISHSMQRVMKEMQYMEQFGCIGFCLAMKPNGKLVTASTLKGEEFLMSDSAVTRRFSEFCNVPVKKQYTKLEVRIFLNKKYSLVAGMPTHVPYKNYQKTFLVEGWPEDVPFKTPARMGPAQLEKVMSVKDDINFVIFDHLVCQPVSVSGDDNSSIAVTQSREELDGVPTNVTEEYRSKGGKRGKKLSFVKRGNIVPVYASQNGDSMEEEDEDTYRFWLFQCSSKVKIDGTITGKWLAQSEEERSFIVLPQLRSIFEANVMVSNGRRHVLMADDFEKIEDGKYQLKVSTIEKLQMLALKL